MCLFKYFIFNIVVYEFLVKVKNLFLNQTQYKYIFVDIESDPNNKKNYITDIV